MKEFLIWVLMMGILGILGYFLPVGSTLLMGNVEEQLGALIVASMFVAIPFFVIDYYLKGIPKKIVKTVIKYLFLPVKFIWEVIPGLVSFYIISAGLAFTVGRMYKIQKTSGEIALMFIVFLVFWFISLKKFMAERPKKKSGEEKQGRNISDGVQRPRPNTDTTSAEKK